MNIIEDFCKEKYDKNTKELTDQECDEFYTWCEQKTPLTKVLSK